MSFLDGLRSAIGQWGTAKFLLLLAIPAVICAINAARAFRYLGWRRMIQNVPTSRTRSAHQGYVELSGVAELMDGPPIMTPMTRLPCVWWSLVTERYNGDKWVVDERECSDEIFYLRDDSGTCIVDPEGARVTAEHRRVTRDSSPVQPRLLTTRSKYRHIERFIRSGDELYIIGWFNTFKGVDHWDHDEELREKLRDWKRDQDTLLRRFDANKDGQIDQDEWDQARKEAQRELSAEHRELSVQSGVNVIGAPADKRPFLIAGEHEALFARRLDRHVIGYALAAVFFAIVTLWMIGARI